MRTIAIKTGGLMKSWASRGRFLKRRPRIEKYPPARLRAIRLNQTVEAVEGYTHYNDGTPIDKSKLIDLHQ